MVRPVQTIITPAQVRGARAMLQMTQGELSSRAGVPRSAIAAFEAEERNPRSATLEKLKAALEGEGLIFMESDSGYGVMASIPSR